MLELPSAHQSLIPGLPLPPLYRSTKSLPRMLYMPRLKGATLIVTILVIFSSFVNAAPGIIPTPTQVERSTGATVTRDTCESLTFKSKVCIALNPYRLSDTCSPLLAVFTLSPLFVISSIPVTRTYNFVISTATGGKSFPKNSYFSSVG